MAILFLNGPRLKNIFLAASKWLIFNEKELNDINVFPVPDGDTGANMGATMKAVVSFLENSSTINDVKDIVDGISNAALMGARGNSGVILSQIFKGFALGVEDKAKLDANDLIVALENGYKQAYKAIADPKEGTILTVVRESVENTILKIDSNSDVALLIDILLNEAKESLDRTPNLLPMLKDAGVVDAGGLGFVYILEGMYKLLHGDSIPEINEEAVDKSVDNSSIVQSKVDPVTHYGYCTEFLIHPTEVVDIDDLKSNLLNMGDSLVLAEIPSVIKVHIHTMNPGILMDYCLKKGIISGIKIENMDEQHTKMEILSKKTLVISVSPGEGISEIFKSLGVGYIINGGQTMNPSVEQIDTIIHRSNSKNIIILPNNSNIVLAAEQVKELNRDKNKNIHVIHTKTIPEGFAAMVAYSSERDFEDVVLDMGFAAKEVKTGEITTAAKNSVIDDKVISRGDTISIYNNNITALTSGDLKDAVDELLVSMIEEDDSIISLYYGDNVTEDQVEIIKEEIENKYVDMDVEVHYGGQPHYFFIVSVE